MSMIVCWYCTKQVDTDFEETYRVELMNETVDQCQSCYDKDPPDLPDPDDKWKYSQQWGR